MQFALGNNLTFICFGVGNLSNFAVIKSLQKYGGCLVDNNAFLLLKASSLLLILSRQLWNFLKLILLGL